MLSYISKCIVIHVKNYKHYDNDFVIYHYISLLSMINVSWTVHKSMTGLHEHFK